VAGPESSLSHFRDLEAFASFASDLDEVRRAQLTGRAPGELLKQPHSATARGAAGCLRVAGIRATDDALETSAVFEGEFLEYLSGRKPGP